MSIINAVKSIAKWIVYFTLLFAFPVLTACGGSGTTTTKGPTPAPPSPFPPPSPIGGWTTFTPDANSRVVYVSSTDGNDTYDGLEPTHTTGNTGPKATIAAGYALIRNGYYDFLLLKRGDVWEGAIGISSAYKRGLDATHPSVISYYGDTSAARPKIRSSQLFINGGHGNYLAIIGIEFYGYKNDPADPAWTGVNHTGLWFAGLGDHILIEDTKVAFGTIGFQSNGGGQYFTNVSLRRTIVVDEYLMGGSYSQATMGSFIYQVHGMNIEGVIYDHNGWNEVAPNSGAQMLNHNFYIDNGVDTVIKDSLIARGSAQNIKCRSDSGTPQMINTTVTGNFIYDAGDWGMGIGGNGASSAYRFANTIITNNVFSENHKANHSPYVSNFSMGLAITDNDGALVDGNYFLNSPAYNGTNDNAIGLETLGTTTVSNRNITISNNVIYNWASKTVGGDLYLPVHSGWSNIQVNNNKFYAIPAAYGGVYIGNQTNYWSNISFSGNSYDLSGGDNKLAISGSARTLAQWVAASGETGATSWSGSLVDPTRTLDSYAVSLGYKDHNDFLAAARNQDRYHWNDALNAPAINAYIKAGYN